MSDYDEEILRKYGVKVPVTRKTIQEIDAERAPKKQERTLRRIGLNLIRAVKRCQ